MSEYILHYKVLSPWTAILMSGRRCGQYIITLQLRSNDLIIFVLELEICHSALKMLLRCWFMRALRAWIRRRNLPPDCEEWIANYAEEEWWLSHEHLQLSLQFGTHLSAVRLAAMSILFPFSARILWLERTVVNQCIRGLTCLKIKVYILWARQIPRAMLSSTDTCLSDFKFFFSFLHPKAEGM